jgi:hypothetical protein
MLRKLKFVGNEVEKSFGGVYPSFYRPAGSKMTIDASKSNM